MAADQTHFIELGFISGWLGVFFCILSFIFLSFKASEQINKIKRSTDNKQTGILIKDSIMLLGYSFGCAFFTLIYCLFYGTFGTNPARLGIIITQDICQYTAQYMANAGWQLSRYCFYNFMLWRIKASFREPQSLKLGNYTFYILFILIHLWLIFVLCITIFFTPRQLTPSGVCGITVKDIFPGFTTSDIRTVAWGFDFGLTLCLLFLFIKRLYQLTRQNAKVNAYKRKTIILGMFATITSITMALCIYLMETKEWRFFIPMDQIINLACVVFTFKFSAETMCPRVYRYGQRYLCCSNSQSGNIVGVGNGNGNGNGNGIESVRGEHEPVGQESTYSGQPNDSEVWNMLVKSQGYQDGNAHAISVLTEYNGIGDDSGVVETEVQQTTTGEQDKMEIAEQYRN